MNALIPPPPARGQLVHVRQRQWLAEETPPAPQPDQAALVRLACVDDDAQGEELSVLWECGVAPRFSRPRRGRGSAKRHRDRRRAP